MIRVLPLDFVGQGALIEPVDRPLHDLAVDYCAREIKGGTVDFSKFSKIWVGLNEEQVFGIAGYVLRPDVPLFRATDSQVLRAIGKRLNDFFADNGVLGKEAFLYIGNEPRESRCPEWREVLKEFGAKSARRVSIEVK